MATVRPVWRSVPRKMEAMPLRASDALDAVVIELFAGTDGNPRERAPGKKIRGQPVSAKQIGPPAVHADAFDAPNAYQLHADIITAVPLVGNIDQSLCRGSSNRRHVPRRPRFPTPVTEPCNPSEHNSSTSSTKTWCSLISAATISSLPRDRLSTCRVAASASFIGSKASPVSRARWATV